MEFHSFREGNLPVTFQSLFLKFQITVFTFLSKKLNGRPAILTNSFEVILYEIDVQIQLKSGQSFSLDGELYQNRFVEV